MFKLPENDAVLVPVTIFETVDNNKVVTHKCSARFKRLKVSEFKNLAEKVLSDDDDTDWIDALKQFTVSFDPMPDDEEFSEYLEKLLDYKPAFDGLLDAFTGLNSGEQELEKRKNLKKRGNGG